MFAKKNIMKNCLIISLLIFNIGINFGAAQECGVEISQEETVNQETNSPPCFDVEYIQENCIPIYVNVNVHFFLDDNCEGTLATADYVDENLSAQNAFQLAEDMINDANSFFETMSENINGYNYQWNAEENGVEPTESQCIPIRYVLNGTYIHCDTEAQSAGGLSDVDQFEVNQDSEMNIFVSNVNDSTNGWGSNSSNQALVENFSPGLLNHELAHALSLGHTFWANDGCDDTWDIEMEWDIDCDGTADLIFDRCWDSQPKYNGQDACDTDLFCESHPCCDWSNQNNNLMTYSGWAGNPNYSALTPCQLTRMLTDLAENMCDYIEDIGCCPPPKAFIGTVPNLDEEMDCPTCFNLASSFNENAYSIQITNHLGNIIRETDLIERQADKYCIAPQINKWGQPFWSNGFATGGTYTITLTVHNECGDSDTFDFTFTLPPPCSIIIKEEVPFPNEGITLFINNISPNPARNIIRIEYNSSTSGNLSIRGLHATSGYSYGILSTNNISAGDNQSTLIDVSSWNSGLNSILIEFENETYIKSFIKE